MINKYKNNKKINYIFFTKNGGHSSGPFSSLNCSFNSGDETENILKNRNKCAQKLGIKSNNLITVNQVHGSKVIKVQKPWTYETQPIADGMVTKKENIALSILTADCAPILFADYKNAVIGVSHAGWKGALSGILENTVKAMTDLGADNTSISAFIGPCISKKSYEVSEIFYKSFIEDNSENLSFFYRRGNRKSLNFDLRSYIFCKLRYMGINNIKSINRDTYSEKDHFFSYRRSSHKNEDLFGRQLSSIVLKN